MAFRPLGRVLLHARRRALLVLSQVCLHTGVLAARPLAAANRGSRSPGLLHGTHTCTVLSPPPGSQRSPLVSLGSGRAGKRCTAAHLAAGTPQRLLKLVLARDLAQGWRARQWLVGVDAATQALQQETQYTLGEGAGLRPHRCGQNARARCRDARQLVSAAGAGRPRGLCCGRGPNGLPGVARTARARHLRKARHEISRGPAQTGSLSSPFCRRARTLP